MMGYKGYFGSVHYDDEDSVFFGKAEFIQSLVSYEGQSVTELKESFQNAVDDYLDLFKEEGKKPEIPFKGSFNVRVGKDLHRKAALYAENHQMSLNHLMMNALQTYIETHKL